MTTDLDREKRRLRAGAEARRAAAAAATEEAGNAVCARLLDAVPVPQGAVVSAFNALTRTTKHIGYLWFDPPIMNAEAPCLELCTLSL